MTFRKRNPKVPFALECALLFVAICVFGWGLQAKLSLYQNNRQESTAASFMAKLSTEKSSARTLTSVDDHDQRGLLRESQYATAISFFLLGHSVAPPANLTETELGPRVPGRSNLHGPDATRRPPPVLS